MRTTHGCEGVLSGQPRISKSLLNARLCRLTETARLLKNVKSVFTRRSNAASRVSVEVELSRKLSLPQDTQHTAGEIPVFTMPAGVVRGSQPPNNPESINPPPLSLYDPREAILGYILSYWGKLL